MRKNRGLKMVPTLLLLITPASALNIGDPAPEIIVSTWIRGGPATDPQENKAIILEFWATWCGPCIDSIPHLSSLQVEHSEDLQVIGMAADVDESADLIQRFSRREDMNYHVAMDKNAQTWSTYMDGMNLEGIPTSFLIDREGYLIWYGHPAEIDAPLQAVLADNYDRPQAIASLSLTVEFKKAISQGRHTDAIALAEQGLNSTTGTTQSQWRGDLMVAQSQISGNGDDIIQNTLLLMESEVLADTLNSTAWNVAANQSTDQRILASMQKLARRAVAMSENQNGDFLDTYARILFYTGDIPAAVIVQGEAVRLATNKDERQWYKANLNAYKNGHLPNH